MVVLSCARATQVAGPPESPVAPARRHLIPVDLATWQARATFDSAARVGDTTRMGTVFASDALLITSAGDSIRGRAAIVHYLSHLAPGARSAELSFGREGALERCVGGARERLSYTARIGRGGQSPDTSDAVSGSVSVVWQRDTTGVLHVVRLGFSQREMQRRRVAECRLQEDSIWRAWRLSVSLFPAAALATSGPLGSFERTLRARGWVAQVYPTVYGDYGPFTPVTTSTRSLPSLVVIQYHLRRHVAVEILGGGITTGSILGARFSSPVDYAQTRLSYSTAFVGALFSYERSSVQLGLGPALQFAHWRLWEWNRPGRCCDSFSEVRWSRVPVGVLGEAWLDTAEGKG